MLCGNELDAPGEWNVLCSIDVLEAEPLFLHKVRICRSHVSALLSFNSHFEREWKIDFVGFKKCQFSSK